MTIISARTSIRELVDEVSPADSRALDRLQNHLIDRFAWHPINLADAYDLRVVPEGKNWGPRVFGWVKGQLSVIYWDPDLVMPNRQRVENPVPYWRTVGMNHIWARRYQPVAFLRPHRPDFE